MTRKAALLGFLAVQVVVVALYATPLIQFLQAGHPLVDTAQQIWSGGANSLIDGNFRTGQEFLIAPTFDPFGPLLKAALFFAGAGVVALASIFTWRRAMVWATAGLAVAALLLGAGGAWNVATQWQGDSAFNPGYLNVDLLYAFSRAFITQVYVGFALLALSAVLVIAGLATRERPLGFQYAAANWVLVASVWLVMWAVLFVLPHKPALG